MGYSNEPRINSQSSQVTQTRLVNASLMQLKCNCRGPGVLVSSRGGDPVLTAYRWITRLLVAMSRPPDGGWAGENRGRKSDRVKLSFQWFCRRKNM